jgi:hypothetical protein
MFVYFGENIPQLLQHLLLPPGFKLGACETLGEDKQGYRY